MMNEKEVLRLLNSANYRKNVYLAHDKVREVCAVMSGNSLTLPDAEVVSLADRLDKAHLYEVRHLDIERVEAWIKALESGKYHQGQSKLCQVTGVGMATPFDHRPAFDPLQIYMHPECIKLHCCLGVMVELAHEQVFGEGRAFSDSITPTLGPSEVWMVRGESLSREYRMMIGLSKSTHDILMAVNDRWLDNYASTVSILRDRVEKVKQDRERLKFERSETREPEE